MSEDLGTGREVTVYEAIGGRAALTAAVDGLYGRLLADSELAGFFPQGVSDRHRRYVVTILAEALGGPERYRGPDLTSTHSSLGISDASFDAVAAHLNVVLSELAVPAQLADQIVGAVASLRPAVVST
ncbi:MAG TPA: group 1 truncated hemoglobin [Streptosporangiaceae bacterium]|nr:group 1 truncated hemoglobin [Streptosporangiaceae bacterium]